MSCTHVIRALQLRVVNFLTKPVVPGQLWESVRKTLAKQQERIQRRGREEHLGQLLKLRNRKIERSSQELAEAKAKVTLAEKAKDTFLGSMSHEFRTPLNHIAGVASLLKCGAIDPRDSDFGEYMEALELGTTRIESIVDSLLTYVSLQTRQEPLRLATFTRVPDRIV